MELLFVGDRFLCLSRCQSLGLSIENPYGGRTVHVRTWLGVELPVL